MAGREPGSKQPAPRGCAALTVGRVAGVLEDARHARHLGRDARIARDRVTLGIGRVPDHRLVVLNVDVDRVPAGLDGGARRGTELEGVHVVELYADLQELHHVWRGGLLPASWTVPVRVRPSKIVLQRSNSGSHRGISAGGAGSSSSQRALRWRPWLTGQQLQEIAVTARM
jgi:hypothetical protein